MTEINQKKKGKKAKKKNAKEYSEKGALWIFPNEICERGSEKKVKKKAKRKRDR
jgi:hypothetical protein